MIIYVTSQERESLYQSRNGDPVGVFEAQYGKIEGRPSHDVREEIVVTDDPELLAKRIVYDPAPVAAPAGDETQ